MAVEDTGAPAAEPVTFGSIAADTLRESENPTDEATPAVADTGTAPEGDPAVASEVVDGKKVDPDEQAPEDEVLNALEGLDRDAMTPENQATYDALVAARKSMQGDYTRKTQAVKQTVAEQVAEGIAAKMAEFQAAPTPQAQPAAPSDEDYEASLWEGLPVPTMTLAEAMEAEGPEGLEAYIAQQVDYRSGYNARKEVMAAVRDVLAPQIAGLSNFVSTAQSDASDQMLGAFRTANPDLAGADGGVDMALKMLESGLAGTLEEAAPMARLLLFGNEHIQKATEMGFTAGQKRQKTIKDAQSRFSVPAGSTGASATDASKLKGKSFAQIREMTLSGELEE